MWLIFLSYLLMASTFTLAKTAVMYMKPIYFIGLRMTLAGVLLLGYLYYFDRKKCIFNRTDAKLFVLIVIFHIYFAYILEFWALQYLSSSKTSLLYHLSPFITALLGYLLFSYKLSLKKWIALIIRFVGMIPILMTYDVGSYASNKLPFAEIILLLAIGSAAYGWIVMKELIVTRNYSPVMVNGVGMLFGGIAALVTAFIVEGKSPFVLNYNPTDMIGKLLLPHFGTVITPLIMAFGTMLCLIIIANIVGYNLFGYLLRFYSVTLLSFFGFMTPFIAGIFGWIFLSESLKAPFFISLAITAASLYLFYSQELLES